MKNAFYLISILFFGLLQFSCQKPVQTKHTSWQTGQPQEALKEIDDISLTANNAQIIYKDQKVQHFQQKIGDQTVDASAVKKIYSQKTHELQFAEATYIDKDQVPKKMLSAKNTEIDSAKILTLLTKNSEPYKIKTYQFNRVLQLNEKHLSSLIATDYELSDGTVWKALLNEKYEVLSVAKMGSQMAETTLNIYTLGPKLSTLTDVIIHNLEKDPTLSNQNIFVDNESNQKITTIPNLLKFDPKDERFDQIQAFYYLSSIQDWMKKYLQVQFVNKLQAVVNVGYPEKTNTAFYFQNKIRLGHGDDIDYTSIASDPSIVYHEAFHAMIDGLAHLPYEKEGGSLNEAFADFFTCVALNRPYLAEASYLKGPYKRTLLLNRTLSEKTGGLYFDSQIVSSLLWETKEKLGEKETLTLATDTLAKLHHYSDFADFNSKFLEVISKNLNTEQQQTVTAILKKRGFRYE